MTTTKTALTVTDLDHVGRARELADIGDVCRHTCTADVALAYAKAFGEAQYLLARMADLAERLAGGDA